MIRLVEESDVEAIHEIYSPYVMDNSITFEQSSPQWQKYEDESVRKAKGIRGLCVDEDKVVGYSYACPVRDRDAYHW